MADENKPAFYPRVGNIKAKNFKPAQPLPFVNDPRAMDLPQYGDLDLSVPNKSNLDMARRIAERDAQIKRQQDADTSPLEKAVGALQAVRFMGSAMTQAINSIPTRLAYGDEAAEKFMQERMYTPSLPKGLEYAGDVGELLEQLETQYKIPPIMPEAVALQHLTGPATSQAKQMAAKGAMNLEKRLDPLVTQALERGGLQRDLLLGLGQGTQSNVIKPKGGNWLTGGVEKQLNRLKMSDKMNPEWYADRQRWLDEAIAKGDERAVNAIKQDVEVGKRNDAISDWIDSNLTNYVKKQMATPEDPVRKLAEEGVLHIQPYGDQYEVSRRLMNKRSGAGFPPLGMGKSEPARFWERQADISVEPYPAGSYKHGSLDESILRDNPWLQNVPDETMVNYAKGLNDLGFDHVIDVLRQDVREGRIRPEQLNKVSMEQAVRRTYEYDQEMAKRMREAALKQQEGFPLHKEYPEGYKWIELAPEPKDVLRKKHEEYVRRDFPDIEKYDPYGFEEYVKDSMNSSRVIDQQKLADALKYEGNTMGHCVGGYCPDVVEGKSRIFSLRDAKGEPHVTVEVQPNSVQKAIYNMPDADRQALAQSVKDQHFGGVMPGARDEDKYFSLIDQAYIDKYGQPAPNIVQIKGKQNAKPKDEYLPYVQDFVRGGNWSDVGDFQNTGLAKLQENSDLAKWLKEKQIELPKYPTKQELNRHEADFLLEKLGQKEFDDLGFGYLKGEEGMKRGGVAISKNPDTMMLELGNQKMKNGVPAYGGAGAVIKQGLKAAKPEIMKASEALGKIEGRPLVITQADRTKVGGGFLGGPGFSSLQLTEPEYRAAEAAWGVKTPGVAKMILGGGNKAGDNPVFTTMIGSPIQHQSNQMVFDKLYGDFKKSAKKGNLDPELRDKINTKLASAVDKEGNPVFPPDVDIMDKKFKDIANTFDRRSIAGHLMGGVQVGGKKGQIIDYDKIIRETTDPALIDVPSGALGNRLFTLSGGIIDRPDLHPAFPTILQGEDLGVNFSPVARDLLMRDFIKKTQQEKGRAPGYMDYTRGYPPSQLITEDILTEMQKLGLKKGGAVKKAEGGAITGDDLIIEERLL